MLSICLCAVGSLVVHIFTTTVVYTYKLIATRYIGRCLQMCCNKIGGRNHAGERAAVGIISKSSSNPFN
jgi:hypothetical protein